MGRQRTEMLSEEAAIQAAEECGVPEAAARLNVFRTLLRRPKTAKAISDLLLSLLSDEALAHRSRELVILRIGWITGCDYEWTQHWLLARAMFGCSDDELLALRDWPTSALFDEADRAVLAATDELVETGALGDASWHRLQAAVGADACFDLVAAIGTWSLISTLARGLEVPLEDGVSSWPPDGRASPAEAGGRCRGT